MITDKIMRDLRNADLDTIKLKERLKSTKSCYGTRVHINQKSSTKKIRPLGKIYLH